MKYTVGTHKYFNVVNIMYTALYVVPRGRMRIQFKVYRVENTSSENKHFIFVEVIHDRCDAWYIV